MINNSTRSEEQKLQDKIEFLESRIVDIKSSLKMVIDNLSDKKDTESSIAVLKFRVEHM